MDWKMQIIILWIPICAQSIHGDYKGLFTNNVRQAHETVPIKVSAIGNHISHDLTSFHSDPNDKIHFNVSIDGKHHLLVLKPERSFLGPSIIIERRKSNIHTRLPPSRESTSCHFQGFIDGQPNSRVTLSACNGLVGLIHSKHGKYYIEPEYHPQKIVEPGHKHLVYKRSAVSPTHLRKRKRKKKKQSNCGTKEPKKMTLLEWQKKQGRIKIQEKIHKRKNKYKIPKYNMTDMMKFKYDGIPTRSKRSISKSYYVEALVVADSGMVEFHQDGQIETYILTLMNMVSSFYVHPTIGNRIQIVVVKIILMDDIYSEAPLNITTNADVTLRNFCKWQLSVGPQNDSHPHHHDVAILLTRKDICSNQDTPCGTLGVAHIGGMCKSIRSCNINEDNGITTAHTIAHELGHNFGMFHDTEKIGCKRRDGGTTHIMTPNFEADSVIVDWSNCSRRELTRFLDKGLGKCLLDQPSDFEEYEYPDLPPGVLYDANHQCRLQFGWNATLCSPPEEICLHLWCTVNNTCTTLLRPAAPGTSCRKHMWCQNRQCVAMLDPQPAIDGGWGEWSEWTPCSRTCGAGISLRSRECDHPKPSRGGQFCIGERVRYRVCNTDPCPKDQPSFRQLQCSQYDNETYEGKKYKWQPYFDQGDPCQLYCSDVKETVIVPWGTYVLDSTPCSVVSRDMCISGICKKVGCDWVVDSQAKEDDCGICQGDGTKCDKKEGTYNKQSRTPGYKEIVVIPRGARNIRIDEKDHSENYICIGSLFEKKLFLNGNRHFTLPGEYTIAGTPALYERDNHLEKIRIPGPILEPIVVYMYFRGYVPNPGVQYKYSIWKQEKVKQVKYSWVLGDWSQCSVTCGGGVRHRLPICLESVESDVTSELERPRTVDESLCDSSVKLDRMMEACNDDPCHYHWWVGPWQACPVTCVSKGKKYMKRRSVMCVDEHETALPDNFCDKWAKPLEFILCKTLPPCQE